ncbi:unnamed protein product [Clavelina lepadiformis]|uniref:Uncharacterized protein n=1 Tax=Clavelina lepadiformis TaxID=159417 RepID=A0ABP0GXK3_CLALP
MASDVGNNQDFCQDFAKCARSKRRNALVPELQKNLFDDDISANLPADIRKLSVKDVSTKTKAEDSQMKISEPS